MKQEYSNGDRVRVAFDVDVSGVVSGFDDIFQYEGKLLTGQKVYFLQDNILDDNDDNASIVKHAQNTDASNAVPCIVCWEISGGDGLKFPRWGPHPCYTDDELCEEVGVIIAEYGINPQDIKIFRLDNAMGFDVKVTKKTVVHREISLKKLGD